MIGIVSFPGSNGDLDAFHAVRDDIGAPARLLDHRATDLAGIGGVILPGGFSYGDHLRCGAIARFAPIMAEVTRFSARGGPVLGICNGFQVLCEAGLLPGALLRNRTLRFHCFWTHVRMEGEATAWTAGIERGAVLRLPLAHGEGAYFAEARTLDTLEEGDQIIARYCDERGNISMQHNPNSSARSIAGVANHRRTTVGLMPHPERASSAILGGTDGRRLLASALAILACPA